MSAIFKLKTRISPDRSCGQIMSLLARAGAEMVATQFDKQGAVAGIAFRLVRDGRLMCFNLPARWQGVAAKLPSVPGFKTAGRDRIEQQARMIAWRQLHAWTEAQLAMVETGLCETAEVFMPYLQVDKSGATLWGRFAADPKYLQLPEPK